MRFTKENIETGWAYVEPYFGEANPNYHNMQSIDDMSCDTDIYLGSEKKEVLTKQVLALNEFVENYASYQMKFYAIVERNLTESERTKKESILSKNLNLEVLSVPYNNTDYDIAVICSIDYKRLLFFKNSISLRVEIKDGKIKSARRTSTTDSVNENRNYAL